MTEAMPGIEKLFLFWNLF